MSLWRIEAFVDAVARRWRAIRGLQTALWGAAVTGAVGLLPGVDAPGWAALAGGVLGAVLGAAWPLSRRRIAEHCDRRLGLHARVETALHHGEVESAFADLQRRDAADMLRERAPAEVLPWRFPRAGAAALLLVAALGWWAPAPASSPQPATAPDVPVTEPVPARAADEPEQASAAPARAPNATPTPAPAPRRRAATPAAVDARQGEGAGEAPAGRSGQGAGESSGGDFPPLPPAFREYAAPPEALRSIPARYWPAARRYFGDEQDAP